MKTLTLLMVVICFGFIFHLDVVCQNSSLANIDDFILNEMEQVHKPGLAACIIKGDSVVWSGNYGYAILEDSLPVADTTLFTLCSIGKSVTAACVLQLWEDGLFDLDENINNFLPFQLDNPYIDLDSVTARMLMIHTSSIVDFNSSAYISIGDPTVTLGYFCENYLSPGGEYYSSDNFLNAIPGTTMSYSTAGSALNGYLVEPLTGMIFKHYARNFLFDPLNMERSAWFLSDLNVDNLAIGYDFSGGTFNPHPHYCVSPYPGATLRSNVFELAHFVIMLMNGGVYNNTQVLNASTVDSMTTLQPPLLVRGLGLTHTYFWNYHETFTREVWGRNGSNSTMAYAATIQFCPDDNTGIVYLSNSSIQPINIQKRLFDYAAMLVIADQATEVSSTQLTAHWQSAPDATGYFLDVALDESFTDFVSGYENLDVGMSTTYPVTDLFNNTDYYYRIRAYNVYDTGAYSNTIVVHTLNSGNIINIPEDYSTIQEGINAANDGDTVLVAPGIYYENISIQKAITVASHYFITQDTSFISQTVIDGNNAGRVVSIENTEDLSLTLCGFKITHGVSPSSSYQRGGAGIYCYNSNPKLMNLIISENNIMDFGWTDSYGGGIWCDHFASPMIIDVSISENFIGDAFRHGGGIAITDQSNPTLKNVVISENSFGEYQYGYDCGTGLYSESSNPILIDVLITDNYDGANVIFIENSSPVFKNTTITQNSVWWGTVIQIASNCNVTLVNSIIFNFNDAINMNGSELTVIYSNILGGESGIQTLGGTINWQEGNIDADPIFTGTGEHPYSLSNESPCINSGTPDTAGLNLPALDLASNPRIYGDRIDMGAYENQEEIVSMYDFEKANDGLNITVQPNPVQSKVCFEYSLIEPSNVIMKITDQHGRLIETLVNNLQDWGRKKVIWDANHLKSGIYFCRINAGERKMIRKFIKVN